jgi:hypothetical protein
MDGEGLDYGVTIMNSKLIGMKGKMIIHAYQADSPDGYIQQIEVYLKNTPSVTFTFCNTHVTFGQSKQLVDVLKKIEGNIICCGDFNVGFSDPRKEACPSGFLEEKEFTLWLNHASYSHINTLQKLDLFDHFYTRGVVLKPNLDLLDLLRKTLDLKRNRS